MGNYFLTISVGSGLKDTDLYCYNYNTNRKIIEVVLWEYREFNNYLRFYSTKEGLEGYRIHVQQRHDANK